MYWSTQLSMQARPSEFLWISLFLWSTLPSNTLCWKLATWDSQGSQFDVFNSARPSGSVGLPPLPLPQAVIWELSKQWACPCLFPDTPGSLLPPAQCLENCYFVCWVLFCLFRVGGSIQILFLYCGQKSLHWLAVINDHH